MAHLLAQAVGANCYDRRPFPTPRLLLREKSSYCVDNRTGQWYAGHEIPTGPVLKASPLGWARASMGFVHRGLSDWRSSFSFFVLFCECIIKSAIVVRRVSCARYQSETRRIRLEDGVFCRASRAQASWIDIAKLLSEKKC